MKNKYKLGIIGAGNMATAILNGILNNKILDPSEIIISDIDENKLNEIAKKGVSTSTNNIALSFECEYLLFAVKPQSSEEILKSISNVSLCKKVISIMAGVTIKKLKSFLGDISYARIMPNTPALVSQGMSVVSFSEGYHDQFVLDIFNGIGKVIELDESLINSVTALSGSGPAYVYMFIKALIEGGIKVGLDADVAKTLAIQTVIGSAEMVKQSPLDIDTLINNVCSKGGTTIQAVDSFKEDNLEGIIIKGMEKCKARADELGAEKPAKKNNFSDIVIYTDGACSGNPGPGGWGVILMYKGHKKELSGAENDTTNNRMELTAIIKGLEALKEPCKVTLYSDSAYSLNPFLQGWISAWQLSGWKKADNKAVQNVDLWERLVDLTKKHTVEFVWVKGHADNEFNNRCDELARQAISTLPPKIDEPQE